MRVLVAGSGGFIGGHLVHRLLKEGHEVRAVDLKPKDEWWQIHTGASNQSLDLRLRENCNRACKGVDQVFNLAADMGGIGFIELNRAACMRSVLINTHLLQSALKHQVERFFYSSSACVYAASKQDSPDLPALKEEDAYPDGRAAPEDGYGWEKLFSERMCRHFSEDYGLETRVARYHNIYGPLHDWQGGREKAPAAICRKVAEAKLTGNHTIDVWGDGTRTRSFTWIDDCVLGTLLLMNSDIQEPLNIGSSEQVSVDELISVVEDIAGVTLKRQYDTTKPMGVWGRNSDNELVKARLGWEPTTRLRDGMRVTYQWISDRVASARRRA